MTPKEKAIQLVESMSFSCRECDYEAKAKQCALIAVDEIINVTIFFYLYEEKEYWDKVKTEIENL
jgi:hypothetical protein